VDAATRRAERVEYRSISIARGDGGAPGDGFPRACRSTFSSTSLHDQFPAGRIEMRLANDLGDLLFTSTSADPTGRPAHSWALGPQRFVCRIPANLLMPGRYFITVTEPCGTYDIVRENVLTFSVTEEESLAARDQRQGKLAPMLEWTVQPG
jgi:hypothetical protein